LNKTQSRVKLKVGLEVLWEGQLYFHGVGSSVVQDNLLSVKLLVN